MAGHDRILHYDFCSSNSGLGCGGSVAYPHIIGHNQNLALHPSLDVFSYNSEPVMRTPYASFCNHAPDTTSRECSGLSSVLWCGGGQAALLD